MLNLCFHNVRMWAICEQSSGAPASPQSAHKVHVKPSTTCTSCRAARYGAVYVHGFTGTLCAFFKRCTQGACEAMQQHLQHPWHPRHPRLNGTHGTHGTHGFTTPMASRHPQHPVCTFQRCSKGACEAIHLVSGGCTECDRVIE